jgi:AraC-like DNA-binding protein
MMPATYATRGLGAAHGAAFGRALDWIGRHYPDPAIHEAARDCLAFDAGDRAVDDIAELLGFSDPSAFHGVFRRRIEDTPRARVFRSPRPGNA